MDSFSLDSIRDVFEADVMRNLQAARAGIHRCLETLPGSGSWLTAVASAPEFGTLGDEESRNWRALVDLLHRIEAWDSFERRLIEHAAHSCDGIEILLHLELDGQHADALSEGAALVATSEGMLASLRDVLRTGKLPVVLGEVDAGPAFEAPEQALVDLLRRSKRSRIGDSLLEEVEHCYHAIRGSSGMVALKSMSECARVMETMTTCLRQLDGKRLELLAQIAFATRDLLGNADELLAAAEAAEAAEAAAKTAAAAVLGGDEQPAESTADETFDFEQVANVAEEAAGRVQEAAVEAPDLFADEPPADEPPADEPPAVKVPAARAGADAIDDFDLFADSPAELDGTAETPDEVGDGLPSAAAEAASLVVEPEGQAQPAIAEPEPDQFSSLEFDEPSVAKVQEPMSRLSALETALNFGGGEPGADDPADATLAEQFAGDLFDNASLAIEPEAEAAAQADDVGSIAFDFRDEPKGTEPGEPANGAAPAIDGVDPELLEIFLEEARQCLGDLRKSFTRVAADNGDVVAWLDLSRHFHLLKGSAGTVGITGLAQIAGELEDRAERYGERKRRASAADVANLRADARRMLAACQIELEESQAQASGPGAAAAAAAAAGHDELARVFAEEAQGILAEVSALVGGRSATARPSEQERTTLAALLHRLKGSAVLYGSEAIGRTAAELHDLCDGDSWPVDGMKSLQSGLAKLQEALGLQLPSAALTQTERQTSEGDLLSVAIEAEPAVWEAFEMEVQESIEQLDRIALELEGTEQPRRRIEDAFRTMHTLKGACNTVGLSPTGAMLHEVETYLEGLQKAAVLPPLSGIVRVLLEALDGVKRNLRQAAKGRVSDCLPRVMRRIKALQTGVTINEADRGSVASVVSANRSERQTAAESKASEQGGRGMLRVSAERLDKLMDLIGELVVQRSQLRTSVASFSRLQKALKKNRQRLFETIDRFREQYEFYGIGGQNRRTRAKGPQTVANAKGATNNLGFSDIELDHYEDVNILARSLEEIDSDITQIQNQIDSDIESFAAGSDGFGALISSLQSEITEARMVPVDQLFLRLRRPVRDAADRLGKDVRVTVSGENVTLDKAIIDQLFAPLLHLVRNSVSHGVEGTDDRRAAGKDAVGHVHLAARQEAGQIVIEVTDDGRGLDLQGLHRIGVERGLLTADTPIDDPRVRDLIFVSGLSTKKTVDAVSGRGVGCDVVRRTIEHLSGVIDVISEAGRGTTFRITMPLTLAIYRALLVRHAGLTFALPISFAERILDSAEVRYHESSGVRRLRLDDQFLEVRDLSQMMGMSEGGRTSRNCVVLRLGPDRIAIGIDEIIGQDEIVVKSLGDLLSGHQMFSGVTVDGEGNLILILEVGGMFQAATRAGSRTRHLDGQQAGGEDRNEHEVSASRRVRVLYADDSLSVRKAAEKFLGEVGVDLILAVDGVDALEKLRASPVDMVFTDLEMPRMHGFELLREMRYVPAFKDLPVVVVTSRSGDKHRQQAEKLGCSGYLAKPFTVAMLREQIIRHVGATAGAGGLTITREETAR